MTKFPVSYDVHGIDRIEAWFTEELTEIGKLEARVLEYNSRYMDLPAGDAQKWTINRHKSLLLAARSSRLKVLLSFLHAMDIEPWDELLVGLESWWADFLEGP